MVNSAPPTISEVEQIAALPDPVVRNLQITQCYHELSRVLAGRTGLSANWCTFATWASRQAGQTIRKEDLGRALEGRLGGGESTQLAAHKLAEAAQQLWTRPGLEEVLAFIWKVLEPQTAFDRSSEAVARGNLKVFQEIGREFARFYATCLDDTVYEEDKIERFCEELRPGEPPEGQRYLRQAFRHYYQALFEDDEKVRIELLLLANIEIGYHEQTRLQPEINEALAAPVIDPGMFVRNLLRALHPEWGMLNDLLWFSMRILGRLTAIDRALEAHATAAQREAQLILTGSIMTIELPKNVQLRLGEDLKTEFPDILRQITNTDLLALLAGIDPTPNSRLESGADFWGNLPDRLHFIADFFRSYQTSAELFEAPFSEEQTATIKEGRLPEGRL